jgi:hypothetical protein
VAWFYSARWPEIGPPYTPGFVPSASAGSGISGSGADEYQVEPDALRPGSAADPAWPVEPARRPPEAVNGSEGAMGASDGPEPPPGPPELIAAASAAVMSAELQAVQLLQRRLRLADLAMRLRENRPKRTHDVRAMDWATMEDAARAVAGLPTTAWRVLREEAGPEGAALPQNRHPAVVEGAWR